MRNKKGDEKADEPRISGTKRNESPEELPCSASTRTNGLKPATINHYLHGDGHNSFFKVEINYMLQEKKE